MLRRRGLVLAIVVGLLCAAVPAAAPSVARAAAHTSDPFADLGGRSPACDEDVGPIAKDNCLATGSVAHQYPVGNYGLDAHVNVGITHLDDAFLAALQSVGGLVWMALVYLLKGVLLLLEWGFSIDLLSTAMGGARRSLTTLHDSVLGESWFLAAISVTALWGMWRGLVQRQASQTIAGLLATVMLMVGALVILARPNDTVGYASRLANEAALGILAAATAQPLDRPIQSLAEASRGVFDSLVRDPWCALEFGSVDYCDGPAFEEGGKGSSVAEQWLAISPGSKDRTTLFHLVKGDLFHGAVKSANTDPARVRLQEADGTFSRLAILGLIAIGLLGAIALLAYLGIRLLLASVLALILLLFAPAMLLAPAFGESGRATFVAWFKRLAGAIATKLIYALFLAVVLAAAAILRRLEIGWFGTWLLQIAFWWGVLIKRDELIGFVSVKSQPEGQRGGFLGHLAQGYYAIQMGRTIRAATQRVLSPPSRATHAVAGRVRDFREQRAVDAGAAAGAELDELGRRHLEGEHERATISVAQKRQAERQLRVIDRRLAGFDETHATARASSRPTPLPSAEQASLIRQRRVLLDQLASPAVRGAEQMLAHAERNRAQAGEAITQRDLRAYRERRAADFAANLPLDHDRHVRAAGLDPAELAAADPPRRTELLKQVGLHVERERKLLAAAAEQANDSAGRELRVDPATVRARRAQRVQEQRFTRWPKAPS